MPSNIPSLSAGNTLSASSHWNVMKADVDTVWDACPLRWDIWHRTSTVVVGNAITSGKGSVFTDHDGWYYYQTSPADGDTFTNEVVLGEGTYTMYVYGVTSAISAFIDWTLGGSSIATAQDWYSASTTYDVTKTVTGITVVTEPSRLVLQGTVNSRNGSSGGWRIQLTRIWFKRSADT